MKLKEIQGFKVLQLKFSPNSTSYHEIYLKEHVTRHQSSETPSGRTLFVINLPYFVTEASLKRIFSVAGPVKHVIFKQNASTDTVNQIIGYKIAYIVFGNGASLIKALKLTVLETISNKQTPIVCGIKKWIEEYNQSIVDPKMLHEEIQKYMDSYDAKTQDEMKQEQIAGEENDDGWITVTKHGRNPGLARKEILEKKIKEQIEKGNKKKELKNFYTFQIRESKIKHLANLRQKFEEDKKKISALKQARKFRPF